MTTQNRPILNAVEEQSAAVVITSILFSPSEVDDLQSGYSALHLAAYKGHEDIVEILLAYGANVDRKVTFLSRTIKFDLC